MTKMDLSADTPHSRWHTHRPHRLLSILLLLVTFVLLCVSVAPLVSARPYPRPHTHTHTHNSATSTSQTSTQQQQQAADKVATVNKLSNDTGTIITPKVYNATSNDVVSENTGSPALCTNSTQAIDCNSTSTNNTVPTDPTPAEPALPEPIVATWISYPITLSPNSASPPDARCDHSFLPLEGKSVRPNLKVPFADGTLNPPAKDVFQATIWMYGGHSDGGAYNDSWLVDVSVIPPVWTQINQVQPGRPGTWGTPISFIPNGLHPDDTGLTAVIYSGVEGSSQYIGDASTFNFASKTWRVMEHLDPYDPARPFPRGYTEWYAVPVGHGKGGATTVNTTIDSGDFLLVGGLGTPGGGEGAQTDHDWSDLWVASLTSSSTSNSDEARKTLSWEPFSGSLECAEHKVICRDAQPLNSFLLNLTGISGIDKISSEYRPEELNATMMAITSAWQSYSTPLTNSPDPCRSVCLRYPQSSNDTSILPFEGRGLEGTRGVVIDDQFYEFGGFNCALNGFQTTGGTDCYLGSMSILNITSNEWTIIHPPPIDSPWFPYWPTRRGYNTLAVDRTRGWIIIHAGAYADITNIFRFYDDTYIFDINIRRFIPTKIGGTRPERTWSAGAAYHNNIMWLFGGCNADTNYNQFMGLHFGLSVDADNCEASGAGLTNATAGEVTKFQIHTRARLNNSTTNPIFGQQLVYGTGLTFAADIVTTNPITGDVTLLQGKVTELGLGVYEVSYKPISGDSYRIFVSLNDETQIPNSPFTMSLAPRPIVNAARTSVSGYGVTFTEKGSKATTLIQLKDEYNNPFKNTSDWKSGSDDVGIFSNSSGAPLSITAFMSSINPIDYTPVNSQYLLNGNGTITLTYDVPTDQDSYLLEILLDGKPVAGSPFTVTALNPIRLSHSVMIAFIILSVFNIALCVLACAFIFRYRNRLMVRASSPNFLYVLVLGSILSSISVIALVTEDSDAACQSYHTLLSTGLLMSMSALLAKSYRVERIFNARVLQMQSNLSDPVLMIPTLGVVLLMLLINLIWIGTDPMRSELRPSSTYPDILTFHQCSSSHGIAFFGAIIAFFGIILIAGVYLAVNTSHVPDQFNESKIIAGATYNIFIMTVIVVPLMFFIGTSSDFIDGRAAIQSLVILWCSAFNVLALIGPKALRLYGILSQIDPNDWTSTAPNKTQRIGVGVGLGPGGVGITAIQQPVDSTPQHRDRRHDGNGGGGSSYPMSEETTSGADYPPNGSDMNSNIGGPPNHRGSFGGKRTHMLSNMNSGFLSNRGSEMGGGYGGNGFVPSTIGEGSASAGISASGIAAGLPVIQQQRGSYHQQQQHPPTHERSPSHSSNHAIIPLERVDSLGNLNLANPRASYRSSPIGASTLVYKSQLQVRPLSPKQQPSMSPSSKSTSMSQPDLRRKTSMNGNNTFIAPISPTGRRTYSFGGGGGGNNFILNGPLAATASKRPHSPAAAVSASTELTRVNSQHQGPTFMNATDAAVREAEIATGVKVTPIDTTKMNTDTVTAATTARVSGRRSSSHQLASTPQTAEGDHTGPVVFTVEKDDSPATPTHSSLARRTSSSLAAKGLASSSNEPGRRSSQEFIMSPSEQSPKSTAGRLPSPSEKKEEEEKATTDSRSSSSSQQQHRDQHEEVAPPGTVDQS